MITTTYLGASALSDFRLQALNRQLAPMGLSVQASAYIYLAQWQAQPSDDDLAKLAGLLEGTSALENRPEQLLIAPRLGTVSPWSSKATDISRVCGLSQLLRLEQGRSVQLQGWGTASAANRAAALKLMHDPLTETTMDDVQGLADCFAQRVPAPLVTLPLGADPAAALQRSNLALGLALSEIEIQHLLNFYTAAERDPTDAELMMFAQINSEHCRHKIFNAQWTRDGAAWPHSLFDMIRMTYAATPGGILSAYKDNAAILDAQPTQRYVVGADGRYEILHEAAAIAIKVETHNHPTAIAPDPGAATGSGGEIRDEAATGRGGKPKAGLCGFSVSDLRIPTLPQPWEHDEPVPARLATALDIMLEAPIGAARYNNEFGRPNLTGYFRTLDARRADTRWGYAKPIMIAGGLGNVRPQHAQKLPVPPGSLVVVLGGPGMLIGLGGSAASSVHAGASSEALDFASVQRANPELERRCQEVIDACWRQADNLILSIHDVGAGGLSNAVPEILNDNELGGDIDLNRVLIADSGLSPMEIWCNESQERYVLAIAPASLPAFEALCARERCPYAVIGTGTAERRLHVHAGDVDVVNMPMKVLLGKQAAMQRVAKSLAAPEGGSRWADALDLSEAISRVIQMPAVASKSFLITIGDRSVSGLVCRDQMVGPWQVPVADVAVTAAGYAGPVGEAMAMGERAPIAMTNAAASGRMAVAEALTNIAAAPIAHVSDIRLSANWMAAAGDAEQASALLETVEAIGKTLCPALGIAIPVGKDSLSMQTRWQHEGATHTVTSPVSLIITAFAPVIDVSTVSTPELVRDVGETSVVLLELPGGHMRLGGSVLAQCYGVAEGATADVDNAAALKALLVTIQTLRADGDLLAYHDRSDGGLLAALLEMAFAARCGLDINLLGAAVMQRLFNEEVGALVQIPAARVAHVLGLAGQAGLAATVVAEPRADQSVRIVSEQGAVLYQADARDLHQQWARTSYELQAMRDEPACAAEEFSALADALDPGLNVILPRKLEAPAIVTRRPPVAILREQGVNGQVEMAWMFERAGFAPVDVHMSDVLSGRRDLNDFVGLAACGGFSYGDVMGAGRGWANSILYNERAREQFTRFFADEAHFALGVCNGCQMLASLQELIPGTENWPRFRGNRSEQFEARLVLVEIPENNSVLLKDLAGARLPIASAHGEGRARFSDEVAQIATLRSGAQIGMQYVDNYGQLTQRFPFNPNGSPQGVAGISNADGRVTIMMPHPERLTRAASFSWKPRDWGQESPWLQMFISARRWVGDVG